MSAHGRYGAFGAYGAGGVDPVSVIFSSITDLISTGGGVVQAAVENRGSTAQLRAKLVNKQGQLAGTNNANKRSKLIAEIITLQQQLAAAQQAELAAYAPAQIVTAPTPTPLPSSSGGVPAWAPYATVAFVAVVGAGVWMMTRTKRGRR